VTLRAAPDERDIDSLLDFGVVNLDKPAGPTAHQVSAWVRDLMDVERAAHAGTLDPKVTGCLPVLTGAATRLGEALIGPKAYVAVLQLHADPPGDMGSILTEFEGPILQKPPRKSAVSRQLRVREVHRLAALEVTDRRVLLDIECEAGTYVRKLCHDLGLALGTGGHMGDLRRTAAAPFDDTGLITLHDLADGLADWRERSDETGIRTVVQPAERALAHLPRVTIAPSAAEEVANGAPVYAPGVIEVEGVEEASADGPLVVGATPNSAAVCLGRLVGNADADSGLVVELERVLA